MFVKTVESLDDYPDALLSVMDCDSYTEATVEAARRAKHLQPGETRVVEFVNPPKYSEKITETVTVEFDIDDPEVERAFMGRKERPAIKVAEEMVRSLPQYCHGEIFGCEVTRTYGRAKFAIPHDVATKYRVGGHHDLFDSYDEAAAFLKDKSEWTYREYVAIEPLLVSGRGEDFQIYVAPIHEKYDVEVDIKMPVENLDYIVFGG